MQNHNNECVDLYQTTVYIDCIITLISYMHTQHYACVDCVTRRHFRLYAVFHTSQAHRCSPLCMHWYLKTNLSNECLTHCRRVTQICVFTFQPCKMG